MSDAFNRNLVLLIFTIAFMYMNFISIQLRTRSGWNNTTCNPLNLFSNSLFQSQDEANRDFERCIVNLSTATTTNLFRKQKRDQENVLTKLSGIQGDYNKLTNEVHDYVVDASDIAQEYTQQINELKIGQQAANGLNVTTSKNIKSYLSSLQDIFNNISSYFG